jgi:phosphoglycolate phosphatase-like HAD superfamily hydrolase
VKTFEAIVFDFDGTLVDSLEIKEVAFGILYKSYGEDIVNKVRAYHISNQGIPRSAKFRHWHENLLKLDYTEEIAEDLSCRFSELVFEAISKAPLIKGVEKFLKKYHLKTHLFIASATPEPEIRKIVSNMGIDMFFRGVFGSPASKTEIIKHILSENDFNPKKVLMVGDTLADLSSAKQSKISFIGINCSKNISNLPKKQIISSFMELSKLV